MRKQFEECLSRFILCCSCHDLWTHLAYRPSGMRLALGKQNRLPGTPVTTPARRYQLTRCRSPKVFIVSWARSGSAPTADKHTPTSLRGEGDGQTSLKRRDDLLLKAAMRRKAKGLGNISQFRRRIQHRHPSFPAQAVAAPIKLPAARPGALQTLPFLGAHKPLGLIAVSAHILGTACQLSGACLI